MRILIRLMLINIIVRYEKEKSEENEKVQKGSSQLFGTKIILRIKKRSFKQTFSVSKRKKFEQNKKEVVGNVIKWEE